MVFWQYTFSPFLESDVIISHVTTKLGVAIKVNETFPLQIWITYVKQKERYGKLVLLFSTRALIHLRTVEWAPIRLQCSVTSR